MYSRIFFATQEDLYTYLTTNSDIYFFGVFLRELDIDTDELIFVIRPSKLIDLHNVPIIVNKIASRKVLITKIKKGEKLLNFGEVIYGAYIYQNEIYDFYGKETVGISNYTLRLHSFPKDFFPYRKIGKPDISEKNAFLFPDIHGNCLVSVPVGPIHAGIIPPGHFRFQVDGEDVLDLEIQLGWKIKLVDIYFMEENNLEKLCEASQDIVGDSAIAYSLGFARNIESSANIKVSKLTKATRIVLLEIERIYNHLWTIGALCNDVGQAYILNGFLSIREEILTMNEKVFGSRLLQGNIQIGGNKKEINEKDIKQIISTLESLFPRFKNLIDIIKFSSGIYDRFKDTGIVSKETARKHNALGVAAKASMIAIDSRTTDEYYIHIGVNNFDIIIGETGDSYDRLMVRAGEVLQSIEIIKNIHSKGEIYSEKKELLKVNVSKLKLSDGYFISNTEGHRGENLQIMIVEKGKITYYKHKDPSFVNWSLLEYAVLKNIIADFPICNKSLDLSYSGFDM